MNARVGHFQYSRTQLQVGGLGKSITAQTAVKHRVGGKIRSHHLQALGPFQWEGQAQALGRRPGHAHTRLPRPSLRLACGTL